MNNRQVYEYTSNLTCARAFDWANIYYNADTKTRFKVQLTENDREQIIVRINHKALGILNEFFRSKVADASVLDRKDLNRLRDGDIPERWSLLKSIDATTIQEFREVTQQVCTPSIKSLDFLVNCYPNGKNHFEANSKMFPEKWLSLRTEDQNYLGQIVYEIAQERFKKYEAQARSLFCHFNPDWANGKSWKKNAGLSPTTLKREKTNGQTDCIEVRVMKVIEEMAADFTQRRMTIIYLQANAVKGLKSTFKRQPTGLQHGVGFSYKSEKDLRNPNRIDSYWSEAAHWCVTPSLKQVSTKDTKNSKQVAPVTDPVHPLYNNAMNGTMELPPIFNRVDYDLTDLPIEGDSASMSFSDYVTFYLNQVSLDKLSPYQATVNSLALFDRIIEDKLVVYQSNEKDLYTVLKGLSSKEPDWEEVMKLLTKMSLSGLFSRTQRENLRKEIDTLRQNLEENYDYMPLEIQLQVQNDLIIFQTTTKQAIFVLNCYQKSLEEFKTKNSEKSTFEFSESSLVAHLSRQPSEKLQRVSSGTLWEKCGPANNKVANSVQKIMHTYWERDDIKQDSAD